MAKKLSETVAVITGASSGIGRATALELSKQGASLVLAARRKDLLEKLTKECKKHGCRAIAVETDVTKEEDVGALALQALREFGAFDVWINNAGVTTVGRFQDVPIEEDRRLIETNVLGYIYGAKYAIKHFHRRGRGTLINVSSIAGKLSEPYSASYTASKHAIRGLSLSLRQELWLEGNQNIHVCTVMPAVIDTPLFQHAGNHMGHPLKAMPPVYPATDVAETIVDLIHSPQDEVFVGTSGKVMNATESVMPWQTHKQLAKTVEKKHQKQDLYAEASSGNLFEPMAAGRTVSGGWQKENRSGFGSSLLLGLGVLASAAAVSVVRSSGSIRRSATVTPFPGSDRQDAQNLPMAVNDVSVRREHGLDKTLSDSFPNSDPPSTLPNPSI